MTTVIRLPELEQLEQVLALQPSLDHYTRIELWYAAVSRRLRLAGDEVLPGYDPRPWHLVVHPIELPGLRRWLLADVQEHLADNPYRQPLVEFVWRMVGPQGDKAVGHGLLVHRKLTGMVQWRAR